VDSTVGFDDDIAAMEGACDAAVTPSVGNADGNSAFVAGPTVLGANVVSFIVGVVSGLKGRTDGAALFVASFIVGSTDTGRIVGCADSGRDVGIVVLAPGQDAGGTPLSEQIPSSIHSWYADSLV